jgi:hypothetical protein
MERPGRQLREALAVFVVLILSGISSRSSQPVLATASAISFLARLCVLHLTIVAEGQQSQGNPEVHDQVLVVMGLARVVEDMLLGVQHHR